MKGLIPAAGKGTRLDPITRAIPKELLMVGDKAIIEYVIDAMKQVGINEITIVVGWKKHALLDYLGSGERLGIKLTYVVQEQSTGLAKAVYAGKHTINNGPFMVVLGDDFFYPKTFLKDILEFHNKKNADATIGVVEVSNPTRHGMIKPGKDNIINDLIEKPSKKKSPSNLGIIGIYIFNQEIFQAIKKTKPGVKNEYQLTDSIKILIESGKKVYYKKIKGKHIDVGTLKDLQKANKFILKV